MDKVNTSLPLYYLFSKIIFGTCFYLKFRFTKEHNRKRFEQKKYFLEYSKPIISSNPEILHYFGDIDSIQIISIKYGNIFDSKIANTAEFIIDGKKRLGKIAIKYQTISNERIKLIANQHEKEYTNLLYRLQDSTNEDNLKERINEYEKLKENLLLYLYPFKIDKKNGNINIKKEFLNAENEKKEKEHDFLLGNYSMNYNNNFPGYFNYFEIKGLNLFNEKKENLHKFILNYFSLSNDNNINKKNENDYNKNNYIENQHEKNNNLLLKNLNYPRGNILENYKFFIKYLTKTNNLNRDLNKTFFYFIEDIYIKRNSKYYSITPFKYAKDEYENESISYNNMINLNNTGNENKNKYNSNCDNNNNNINKEKSNDFGESNKNIQIDNLEKNDRLEKTDKFDKEDKIEKNENYIFGISLYANYLKKLYLLEANKKEKNNNENRNKNNNENNNYLLLDNDYEFSYPLGEEIIDYTRSYGEVEHIIWLSIVSFFFSVIFLCGLKMNFYRFPFIRYIRNQTKKKDFHYCFVNIYLNPLKKMNISVFNINKDYKAHSIWNYNYFKQDYRIKKPIEIPYTNFNNKI
jgi:hypothetical protein